LENTTTQAEWQVRSMTNANGLLHIELPGGLMLTGPCLAAPLPPGFASRLCADAVPDHLWMMVKEDAGARDAAA